MVTFSLERYCFITSALLPWESMSQYLNMYSYTVNQYLNINSYTVNQYLNMYSYTVNKCTIYMKINCAFIQVFTMHITIYMHVFV
jgi:hypothetical protein